MFERLRSAYYAMIALAIFQICLAIALGQSDFWRIVRTDGMGDMILIIGGLFPLIWVANLAIRIAYRQIDRPSLTILRMIRRNRAWLLRGAFFAIMILLFARAFSSFKSSISRLNAFWADPWLADLDRYTFGTDPWLISHALLGPMGTLILDRIYVLWFFMMFLTMAWFCFTRNEKLQIRGLLCYLLSWSMLGGVAAVAMSSVGPCFYEQFYGDKRFAPMMANLNAVNAETPLYSARSMAFLIESLGKDRFGSGISAMPSLHVTIAMLSFLVTLTYSKSILLRTISGLFALAIAVGSVHLGWHYAWDGIFGIIAIIIFWWATGRFVDWLEVRELQQSKDAHPLAAGAKALPATP